MQCQTFFSPQTWHICSVFYLVDHISDTAQVAGVLWLALVVDQNVAILADAVGAVLIADLGGQFGVSVLTGWLAVTVVTPHHVRLSASYMCQKK